MNNLKTSNSLQLLNSCVTNGTMRPRCAWHIIKGQIVRVNNGDSEEIQGVNYGICPSCRALFQTQPAQMRQNIINCKEENLGDEKNGGARPIARKVRRGQNAHIGPAAM